MRAVQVKQNETVKPTKLVVHAHAYTQKVYDEAYNKLSDYYTLHSCTSATNIDLILMAENNNVFSQTKVKSLISNFMCEG